MIFVNKSNYIEAIVNSQVILVKSYIEKLLLKLPQTLEESAKRYGAIIRRRAIQSAVDLMLVLFIYASSGMSQRMLAASSAVMGAASISDQAWQKKIIKCGPWLSCVLSETMLKMSNKSRRAFRGRVVRLLDGSNIQQDGTKGKRGGETFRIHMCYNLTEGCMDYVLLTDNHTAESVTVFAIESGTIYIADAGYGKGKNIAHIISCQADALFRVTPNQISLAEDEKGTIKIDMTKKLDTQRNLLDFTCYVHTEKGAYVPVRMIASRLPEDKALLARERLIRKAKKKQTKNIKEATFVYGGWIILMTTLGSDYSTEDLLTMYRARWQIELLFKRIKQSFAVSKLPAASLSHCKVVVLLWLILWSLTEQHALAMEVYLLDKKTDMTQITPWFMHSFLFHQLTTMINSLWALCFNLDDHSLMAFQRLRSHRSSRCNQYATLRFGG